MALGFAEAEMLVEYGYPTQRFVLKRGGVFGGESPGGRAAPLRIKDGGPLRVSAEPKRNPGLKLLLQARIPLIKMSGKYL